MRMPLRATALSREGRDTLWLLGILTLCVMPHLARLPLWCALGTVAAIVWRGQVAWRDGALPPRVLLLVSLAISMGLTMWSFHSLFGREAGVTLVTLLAGLKTLELRARRDAFVVTSLGFFLILTQFLYSQSLPIAAMMLLALMGLLTALVLAQRPLGRPTILSSMKVAARSMLMGIPVMLALYLLFPRLGPLWSVPADAGQHTGLSDRIKLGSMAQLAQDDSVAMRIHFAGQVPNARYLYFRGPTLGVFDGQNWVARQDPALPSNINELDEVNPAGPALNYQATLEPSRIADVPLLEGTLVAAPTPPNTEPQMRREGLSWMANRPLTDRSQIDGRTWLSVQQGPLHATPRLRQWLQLPPGFNPRTLSWAMQLQSKPALAGANAQTLSNAILTHIRQAGYRYTLTPDDDGLDAQGQPERHLIDRFWLDRKAGFCEHYATAYVVIMRAMGVPSRVVTGYQGAELNPVDGLYVVRNSDAHAWAEFWQDGDGWLRVDPTAAVAPDRVDQPRHAARDAQALPGPLSTINPVLWGRMRDYIDAGNHRWNIWVLQYSRNSQLELLRDLGDASPDWVDLVRLCGAMLAGMAILGMGWLWWTRPRSPKTPWHKPLMRVHRALVSAGLPAPHGSPAPAPALSWVHSIEAAKANEHLKPVQHALMDALHQLDALRYGPPHAPGRPTPAKRKALIEVIEQQAQLWRAGTRRDRAN